MIPSGLRTGFFYAQSRKDRAVTITGQEVLKAQGPMPPPPGAPDPETVRKQYFVVRFS